jgi:hypothetical protein
MSMEVVNGYVCFDCTDVARAKKGEDPATKPNSPEAKDKPFGAANDDEARGVNRPLAAGDRGTKVNLLL